MFGCLAICSRLSVGSSLRAPQTPDSGGTARSLVGSIVEHEVMRQLQRLCDMPLMRELRRLRAESSWRSQWPESEPISATTLVPRFGDERGAANCECAFRESPANRVSRVLEPG